MKSFPALVPATVLLVPALLLTGCGGSNKPASTSSASGTPSATASADALVPLRGEGFTVSLPGRATSTKQTFTTKVGPVTGTVYTVGDNDSGFFAALVPYPPGSKVSLDGAITGIARGYSGEVRSNQDIEFQGLPARQAAVTGVIGGQAYTFYVLAVDDAGKLFQLIHALKGPPPAAPPAILGQVSATLSFD